jgi:hypothetical protein
MASNPNQFLTIPAKKPFDVNLSTPIKNFIKATFGDKEDYSASVDGFNSLRAEALLRSNYKDDCSKLLRLIKKLFHLNKNKFFDLDIMINYMPLNINYQ